MMRRLVEVPEISMNVGRFFTAAAAAVFISAMSGQTARAAECPPVPDVPWWNKVSHDSMKKYVARKHKGDWSAYIAKWERQKEKLQAIYDRGSAVVVTKDKIKLKGERLREYIDQVNERIEVTRCLSGEAAASGGRDNPNERS